MIFEGTKKSIFFGLELTRAGLSAPDSDMLISLSEVLETPVSTLLGEMVDEPNPDDLKVISEKPEVINFQLAKRKITRQKIFHWGFVSLCALIVIAFAVLFVLKSPYLGRDYSKPETEVMGVGFHALEWLFVRVAPIVLIGAIGGAFLTRKKIKIISQMTRPAGAEALCRGF